MTVHLVYGFLGAGKTTFARELADRTGAVRFSIDEWYLRLFPDETGYALDPAALARLVDTLNDLWPQLVAREIDVVLDFGFWSRALRDTVRARAATVGASTRLHWVRCDDALALSRCLARNGAEGAFRISEEGFREMKQRFEPLGADETFEAVDSLYRSRSRSDTETG